MTAVLDIAGIEAAQAAKRAHEQELFNNLAARIFGGEQVGPVEIATVLDEVGGTAAGLQAAIDRMQTAAERKRNRKAWHKLLRQESARIEAAAQAKVTYEADDDPEWKAAELAYNIAKAAYEARKSDRKQAADIAAEKVHEIEQARADLIRTCSRDLDEELEAAQNALHSKRTELLECNERLPQVQEALANWKQLPEPNYGDVVPEYLSVIGRTFCGIGRCLYLLKYGEPFEERATDWGKVDRNGQLPVATRHNPIGAAHRANLEKLRDAYIDDKEAQRAKWQAIVDTLPARIEQLTADVAAAVAEVERIQQAQIDEE